MALVFLALVVGTTVSLWQAVRASQAAGEARERADELKQVVGYLAKDIYDVATPGKRRSRRSVTVGELLDHADATLGDRYRLQPLVEASVRMALAGSAIVEHEKGLAEQNVARTVQIRERFLGPEDPATLEALSLQAWLLCCAAWDHTSDVDIHNNRTAESIARRVLASSRRVLGPAHSETLRILRPRLAHIVSNLGRHEEAEALAAEVEGLAIRYLSPEHEVTLLAQHILGLIAERRGNLAVPTRVRHVIVGCESSRGTFDITTIYALERLANVVRLQGRADEARQLHLEAVNRFAEVYGLCGKPTGLEIMYLFSLLEEQRDLAAIRDLCEGWIREILAMPPEPDRYDRYRRSVQLSGLALRWRCCPRGYRTTRGWPFVPPRRPRHSPQSASCRVPGSAYCSSEVPLPSQHRGVAMLFGDGRSGDGRSGDGPADGGTGPQAQLAGLRQRPGVPPGAVAGLAAADLKELAASHHETGLVLSAALAAVWTAPAAARVRVMPPGQPSTAVWWGLIDELTGDAGHPDLVVAADYDPDLRYLCLAGFDTGPPAS